MSEILPQSQIDSLLNELYSGEIDSDSIESKKDKKVKEYDFKNPKKVTKEELKVLKGIYDNFARHLSLYFSGILRINCDVSISSVEEQPYFEYNNALPDLVMIGILDIEPFERSVLVDISNPITFTLIERLLGGTGSSITLSREFTEIEIAVMDRIFKQIALLKKEAWSKFLDIEPTMKQIETNSRLIQSLSADEDVIIIVMDITIKSVKGTISVCIPCINLESILTKSINNQNYAKKELGSGQEQIIKESIITNISGSQLKVSSIIGETMLTLNEVMNLQIGDVVKLEQSVDSNVKINIEDKTWFYGIPGIRRNKKVVKINKVL